MFFLITLILSTICTRYVESSAGDHSPYYQRCVERCSLLNCTDDGLNFMLNYEQPIYLNLLQWSCEDECHYECMWKTVEAFHERKWRTPQFYGKWPFIRFFGIQEPASVLFSILNLYAHVKMIELFRQKVTLDSPLYWLWHIYSFVCMNAWLWSSIFHTRDFPLTEFMDYSCAFSMVFMSFYCMVMRLSRESPPFIKGAITVLFLSFFINHVAYLLMAKFDYGYNMKVNIVVGTLTAISWFGWCVKNRKRQPYVWKCALFVVLTGLCMIFEVIDRPPVFYTFDFHSIWHLSTAPLNCLFYSFAIDDCNYLKKHELVDLKTKQK